MVYARIFSRSRPGGEGRAAALAALALLVALLTGGCRSSADKANAYEALYDQMMPNQAYPTALAAITKATALDESEPRRWIKLGNVQMAVDRPAMAYLSYQRALDLAPDNVEALQNLSILAVRSRDYDSAKRFVAALLVLVPNDASGLLASGAIATYEKRYKDAEATAAQMIAAAPDQPDGYALRLMILRAQERLGEAAVLLEQRSAINPQDSGLLLQMMEVYQARGDVAGVRRTAMRLAPLFPNDPRYAMESARALQAEGRTEEAQKQVSALAQRYRFNSGLVTAAAQFWGQTLPHQQAVAKTLRLADSGSPATKAALGNVLLDMGAIPQTVTLLAPLTGDKVAAGNIDPHIAYARALFLAGRGDEAAGRVAQILDFDATNVTALLLRARLRLAGKQFQAALNDAQLAAAGDQGSEEAAMLIGQIYLAMGNKPLAWRAFGEARGDFPNSFAVVQAWSSAARAQGDAPQALSVAADYARRHVRSDAAWALYGKLCAASADPTCADEVRSRGRG